MYTDKEIRKDFFEVEGMKVDLTRFTNSEIFLSKYSERFNKQIDPGSTREDLDQRVREYVLLDQRIKDASLRELFRLVQLPVEETQKLIKYYRVKMTMYISASLFFGSLTIYFWYLVFQHIDFHFF